MRLIFMMLTVFSIVCIALLCWALCIVSSMDQEDDDYQMEYLKKFYEEREDGDKDKSELPIHQGEDTEQPS